MYNITRQIEDMIIVIVVLHRSMTHNIFDSVYSLILEIENTAVVIAIIIVVIFNSYKAKGRQTYGFLLFQRVHVAANNFLKPTNQRPSYQLSMNVPQQVFLRFLILLHLNFL